MANVRRCFGPQRVALASIVLAALYFALTGTFVTAVGILRIVRRLRDPRHASARAKRVS